MRTPYMRFVTRAHPKPNQEKLLPPSSGMKRKRRLQVQAAGQGVPLHGTPPADRPGARAEGQLWGPDAEERAVQVEPAGEPDGAGRQVTGVRKSQVCASHRCAPSHRCAQVVRLCHLHGKAWVCIWVHGCACACISVCVCVSCVVPAPAYVLKGLEVQGFGRMVIIFMK